MRMRERTGSGVWSRIVIIAAIIVSTMTSRGNADQPFTVPRGLIDECGTPWMPEAMDQIEAVTQQLACEVEAFVTCERRAGKGCHPTPHARHDCAKEEAEALAENARTLAERTKDIDAHGEEYTAQLAAIMARLDEARNARLALQHSAAEINRSGTTAEHAKTTKDLAEKQRTITRLIDEQVRLQMKLAPPIDRESSIRIKRANCDTDETFFLLGNRLAAEAHRLISNDHGKTWRQVVGDHAGLKQQLEVNDADWIDAERARRQPDAKRVRQQQADRITLEKERRTVTTPPNSPDEPTAPDTSQPSNAVPPQNVPPTILEGTRTSGDKTIVPLSLIHI